ncbi:MAG TPA: ankyrin repeat domain-containing protein [Tepidisphaeraceae bacterium]|nr:ankyrin repeat domain-containing protein [Tepidisphaeraceae bacterium]
MTGFLTAVSFWLCVMAAVAWVDSYHTATTLHYYTINPEPTGGRYCDGHLLLARGSVSLTRSIPYVYRRQLIYKGFRGNNFAGPVMSVTRGPLPDPDDPATPPYLGQGAWKALGFAHYSSSGFYNEWMGTYHVGVVPLWAPTLAGSLLPGAWLLAQARRWRRARAVRRGFCGHCGYDLRADPVGSIRLDRCPECGSARPAAPSERPRSVRGLTILLTLASALLFFAASTGMMGIAERRFFRSQQALWATLRAEALANDALMAAVKKKDLRALKASLQAGADPNSTRNGTRSETEMTPIAIAAQYGQWDMVDILLDHGADPRGQERYGCDPLRLAAAACEPRIIKRLLQHGADAAAVDVTNGNNTPLHLVADSVIRPIPRVRDGMVRETVDLLVAAGANVNAVNEAGFTPLSWAVHRSRPEVVDALLAHGADVNTRDANHRTPLGIAKADEDEAMVQLLQSHGGKE